MQWSYCNLALSHRHKINGKGLMRVVFLSSDCHSLPRLVYRRDKIVRRPGGHIQNQPQSSYPLAAIWPSDLSWRRLKVRGQTGQSRSGWPLWLSKWGRSEVNLAMEADMTLNYKTTMIRWIVWWILSSQIKFKHHFARWFKLYFLKV